MITNSNYVAIIDNIDLYIQIYAIKIDLAINLVILSVFFAPNKSIDKSPLKNLNFKHNKVLICGDFNSHHMAWVCEYVRV